jgi:hypothetical protein
MGYWNLKKIQQKRKERDRVNMNKFVTSILVSILFISQAKADPCSAALTGVFTGNQAIQLCEKGLKTVSTSSNFETVAGAGTTQGTAAILSGARFTHRLTGANGTVGWLLPTVTTADIGEEHIFLNTTAGVANLYPEVGGTINGASANAVFAALTGIKPIICYVTAAATWVCA